MNTSLKSKDQEFKLPIRVYIEDTDAGGIVYYVNYLKFIERSRTEFLRSLGYGKTAILENGLLLVVHSMDVNYLAPARLDDEVLATTRIQKLARSYVVFEQEVRRGEIILCQATVKVACVSPDMKPTAFPKHVYKAIHIYTMGGLSE